MKIVHAYPSADIKARLGLPERPLDLFPRPEPRKIQCAPTIGITGATGWLGRHLARRLLHQDPGLHLVVPVRASSADHAMARLRQCWAPSPEAARVAIEEGWWDRTHVHPISQLSREWVMQPLCNGIDALDIVVHGAADMSLALSLDAAWESNVVSTQNAYHWACRWGARRFDHISTLSVFIAGSTPPGPIEEDDSLDRAGILHGGYGATKWAAEAWLSAQSAIDIAVHRLGLLSFSSTDGWATGDGLHAVGLAWKRWGRPDFLSPTQSQSVDWSPVDRVARGICEAIQGGHLGALHWAGQQAVPASLWVELWSQHLGSGQGDWPVSDPLAKQACRALGRWHNPRRAKQLWWHDVLQSGPFQYGATHAAAIMPRWSFDRKELELALARLVA